MSNKPGDPIPLAQPRSTRYLDSGTIYRSMGGKMAVDPKTAIEVLERMIADIRAGHVVSGLYASIDKASLFTEYRVILRWPA
jgi:hypothetical protein